MWTAILGFLGGPVINGLLSYFTKRMEAMTAQDQVAGGLVVKAMEAEIAARQDARAVILAEQGRWWTAAPRSIVQWSFALFVFKVVVWDNVLGLGTTDPLGGDVANWAGMVMVMWFGGRTLEKVAASIAGRFVK